MDSEAQWPTLFCNRKKQKALSLQLSIVLFSRLPGRAKLTALGRVFSGGNGVGRVGCGI